MKLLIMMDGTQVTGPARQLFAVTPFLKAAGIDCEFVVCVRRGIADTPFWKAIRELGLPIHLIRDRFACDPALVGQFKRVVATVRPDLLQTHGYRPNTLGRLLRRTNHTPWIAFFHGFTWENWKIRAYNRVDVWAMARADLVATVSQHQADQLRRRLPGSAKISVIPNAVLLEPVARDESLRRQLLGDGNEILLGVFGRFSREKGQDVFLHALARLVQSKRKVSAILLGEGPDEAKLRQLAERLHIADRVRFGGYQPDIARYYSAIDLLVVPSRSEGLPNVILEAQSCGTPVAACAVGGVPELIADGQTGLLVPPDDPRALSAAIDRLSADPPSAVRQAAAAQSAGAQTILA